ncbi:MAG: sortase [Clostridia bacterium]|nr:sortase [Clostridia bacterium]
MQPSHISTLYSATIIPYDNFDYSGIYHSIGTLEIPAIKLNLPILSELNDDLLKLSACHFYGPTKNTVGNICIAGHNYNDGSLFSNIPRLSIGDVIIFTDLNNNICYYTVYDKFEISSNNTACTSQDTNGQKEITLVTCNNFTGNRVIVKAISL